MPATPRLPELLGTWLVVAPSGGLWALGIPEAPLDRLKSPRPTRSPLRRVLGRRVQPPPRCPRRGLGDTAVAAAAHAAAGVLEPHEQGHADFEAEEPQTGPQAWMHRAPPRPRRHRDFNRRRSRSGGERNVRRRSVTRKWQLGLGYVLVGKANPGVRTHRP